MPRVKPSAVAVGYLASTLKRYRAQPATRVDLVTAPTDRLTRKIWDDFPERADDVIARLTALPDTSQATERIQAAIVVRSGGDFDAFLSELQLVAVDWRDTLMYSGLEHADYEEQLDRLLGPAT